ncbi:MAG: hypothetical protein RIQ54_652 [Candidatus Parcubacteria bacterium]|jgi:hypothetical protein
MKKIIIEKDDSASDVVHKMLATPHTQLTLVVPRGARIKTAITNFYTIEKEATRAGRTIIVESVDDEVLAFSRAAGIESTHPLFQGNRQKNTTTDIVFSSHKSDRIGQEYVEEALREDVKHQQQEIHKSDKNKKTVEIFSHQNDADEDQRIDAGIVDLGEDGADDGEDDASIQDKTSVHHRSRYRPKLPSKRVGMSIIGIMVVAGIGIWITDSFFSYAQVTIELKKVAWAGTVPITADMAAQSVDIEKRIIPAELFFQQKNVTQLFPATGIKTVAQKATGKVTIFNAYSSQPQSLVASTRFETADGKIFRLEKGVTVPGAGIENGKITPASIDADIIADKPGDAYNSTQDAKATIPGFKNSPKFDGFYGVIHETKGGFEGKKPYPTDADIQQAKQKTSDLLKSSLRDWYSISRIKEFKILDGANDVKITKVLVNDQTDEQGNFSVFAEGALQVLAFREKDIQTIIAAQAATTGQKLSTTDTTIQSGTIEYDKVTPDFNNKKLSIDARSNIILTPAVDAVKVQNALKNQSVQQAQEIIGKLPDVANAQISLWPFWRTNAPSRDEAVRVTIK